MRHMFTALLCAGVLAVPTLAIAQSAEPAAAPAKTSTAATHSVQGVVKSVDASSLVITRPGKKGGEMAFYVGFQARDVFRGVATIGSTLGTAPKDNVANQPLSFFLAAGDKDPLLPEIEAGKDALKEKKFPVVHRVIKEFGKEYFDEGTFAEFLVWLDSLDRI